MHRAIGRISLWASALILVCLLAPSATPAQVTIPFRVTITQLVEVNFVDDLPPNLGDFYPEVYINGTRYTNSGYYCDNPGLTGAIVPFEMFNGTVSNGNCFNTPWTFAIDLPLSEFEFNENGIPVKIEIWDSDLFNDDVEGTYNLNVPFGGRWTGIANWPENCAYSDETRICWEIEAGNDADGDGLLDEWETNGLDADGNGSIDLNLPAMGANPNHKDLYVELDWRPGFEPQRAEVLKWKEAFAAAPVDAGGIPNPDGLPGINLRVDTGSLTEGGVLVGDNLGGGNPLPAGTFVCTMGTEFYDAKAANFNDAVRRYVFRYGITATQCCVNGSNPGTPCFINSQCLNGGFCHLSGGQAEIGGNDFVVWNTFLQGSTLMHELGHTLTLQHGGGDGSNCKPNYLSIMNYDHDELQRLDGTKIYDFSPPRLPGVGRGQAPLPVPEGTMRENTLDENKVLDASDQQTFLIYTDADGDKRLSLVGQKVDWDGNGAIGGVVAVNVNTKDRTSGQPSLCENSSTDTVLNGHNDWANVSLPFLQFGESASGPINLSPDTEPTGADVLAHRQIVNTTDLAVDQTGNSGPVEAGTSLNLSYTINVANQGANPALPARVLDTMPAGASVVTLPSECAAGAPGTLTCDLVGLLPGQNRDLGLTVRATAACASGIPQNLVNQAVVSNGAAIAGADPDSGDNTKTFVTTVVDTTAPTGEITFPLNNACFGPTRIPVTVQDNFTDACDANLTRTYAPPPGPSYNTHGDKHVTLTVKDEIPNTATDTVDFTIDLIPPVVTFLQPTADQTGLPPVTIPIRIHFSATDDDNASGGILREVIKLQGCTIYDGNIEGDRDGLLSDEFIQLTKYNLCQHMTRCRFTTLSYPTIRVEATDACGNNTGSAQRIIRKRLLKTEVCQ